MAVATFCNRKKNKLRYNQTLSLLRFWDLINKVKADAGKWILFLEVNTYATDCEVVVF